MTYIAVVTTVGSKDEARTMAHTLVARGLVACAQISEIESIYPWNGVIQTEPEYRLLLKTCEAHYDALAQAIRALHSYQLPAVFAHALLHVDAPYAQWIDDCTRRDGLP
jgi:periplasmic divalent cation tolerance protein